MATITASRPPQEAKINNFLGLNPNSSLEIKLGEAVDIENWRIKNDFNIQKREGIKEKQVLINDIPITLYINSKNQYCKLLNDTDYRLYSFYEANNKFSYIKIDPTDFTVKSFSQYTLAGYKFTEFNLVFLNGSYLYVGTKWTKTSAPYTILYYLLKLDGTSIDVVEPTIPTLYKSANPLYDTDISKKFEPINILTKHRKMNYIATSTDYNYWFPETATSIESVTINGGSTSDYTFTEGNNYIHFNTLPTTGNTVEIEFVSTEDNKISLITNCVKSMYFGGKNDVDLFVWGNPDHPNTVYHCLNGDVTYFAEDGYRTTGENTITDIVTQNTLQLVFTDNEIYTAPTNIDSNGYVTYPLTTINDQRGHKQYDVNANVQIVNNKPVFLGEFGSIYELEVYTDKDERNVNFLSKRDMSIYLKSTSSITRTILSTLDNDFKKEYIIFYSELQNGVTTYKALVYNYYNNTWYKFSGLTDCYCPILIDGKVYCFGTKYSYFDDTFSYDTYLETVDGEIVERKRAIDAYYEFPFLDFGYPQIKKAVNLMGISLQPDSKLDSFAKVEYWTNLNTTIQSKTFQLPRGIEPKLTQTKVSIKNAQYIKLKVISNTIFDKAEVINLRLYITFNGMFK